MAQLMPFDISEPFASAQRFDVIEQQRKAQEDERKRLQSLYGMQSEIGRDLAAGTFDPAYSQALQQMAAIDPEGVANRIAAFRAIGQERTRGMFEDAQKGLAMAKSGQFDQLFNFALKRRERVIKAGGDTVETDSLIAAMMQGQDPTPLLQNYVDVGIRSGLLADSRDRELEDIKLQTARENLKQLRAGSRQPKQKAEGGLVFDPNTGTYSIDEVASARFDELRKQKEAGEFGAQERQSINKDVTGFIKDATLIKNTAADLEQLKKLGGGAASIASVYKFMKALDPTSVVREGEFATAENASGVPETVSNFYNKLISGERLGDQQFNQFVIASKVLANNAIDSSNSAVMAYLDTFENSLPASFKDKITNRVPTRFAIDQQAQPDEQQPASTQQIGRFQVRFSQ